MKNNDAIDGSIAFIESRLTETLCVEALAQQALFSKTHYQRLFRAIVGEPVMAFVKNRRLQMAGREVLAGRSSVLAIALKYGYDSHEGFTRAFKAYFGVTPTEYRTNGITDGKPNETEAVSMLSNEVLNRIGQNAEKTYAVLSHFIKEGEKLSAHACKTADAAGVKGTTTTIVAGELNNLTQRMKHLRDEKVKSLAVGSATAFEMFERIWALMRGVDDGVFQMNLLRFFSGVEMGRIAPPKDEFDAIDNGYATLCGQMVDSKAHLLALMNEAIELLHTDIKQEARRCIESAVCVLKEAAENGESTAASARKAAASLGEYGGAFTHIANAITESVSVLQNVTEDFMNTRNLPAAVSQLANTALFMNINALNGAVETARAGHTAPCTAAAEAMMRYAGVMQKAYRECAALRGEYERLIELTNRNSQQCEQALAEKYLDDILFQGQILSSQFALEAERINRDTFRSLARTATAAHAQLIKTRNLAVYREAIEAFLQALIEAVSHLEIGGSFAYFTKEYTHFLGRLKGSPV